MRHANLRFDPEHHIRELMQSAVDRISGTKIRVQIEPECVCLSGEVNSWHKKQFAQECIRPLSGERTIMNELRVNSAGDHFTDYRREEY